MVEPEELSQRSISSNSDEESDLSESEIIEYAEKPYDELKKGNFKVKGSKGTFKCPFCAGKKKQEYKYKDLLQHATGVSNGSINRSAKQKSVHLALSRYLKEDLSDEAEPIPSNTTATLSSASKNEKVELYCWPWMGIIVNILCKPDSENDDVHSKGYWLKEFSKYKPQYVEIFQGVQAVVVLFGNDWDAFKQAMEFEKSFETRGRSKKEWKEAEKTSPGPVNFGWFARDNDYRSEGPIGEYLRRTGELKTIADLVQEVMQERNRVVANLTEEIDMSNENLDELQMKYNEKSRSLSRMIEEKDMLHHNFCEETRRLQRQARDHVQRVLYEQETLNTELENKRKQLDTWSKELNKREALTERDKQKLDNDKKKNDSRNSALQMASEEQRKADENVLRLVEEQKREKGEALKKILDLERDLDAKQKLEMEITELKGNLDIMKHLGDGEAVQNKIKEMNEKLNDKIEEMSNVDELYQTLVTKERQSNDELQEARKELIKALSELLSSSRTHIGIKKMGEIDKKIFDIACKQKFPNDSEINAAIACSLWQDKLKNSEWYPFKVIRVSEGVHEKLLDECDETLQELRSKWGDEVYAGVTEALKEMDEYNASGRYPVAELWNFQCNRKATLKEVISFIFNQLKSFRRKKTTTAY